MPKGSYQLAGFIGGEVSPLAQGRIDQPWYRQALTLSLNGVTVEEGAWVKRSGTEFIAPTRWRTYAKLIGFDGSATCSFAMVFTGPGSGNAGATPPTGGGGTPANNSSGNLQFATQGSLIFDGTIATITSATNPAGTAVTIGLGTAPGAAWNAGDQVMIVFPDVSSPLYPYPPSQEVGLRNRMLTIGTVLSTTSYTLANDLGVNLAQDGSVPSGASFPADALQGAQIARVLNVATPYNAGVQQLQALRAVQIEYQSVVLSSGIEPYVTQITTQGTDNTDPTFSFDALGFIDGPYLDPYTNDGSTVSGYTGTITFTSGTTNVFYATDVGRHIRIFTQPPLWASGTTYSQGANVSDSTGAWWTSLINSNAGNLPGQPATIGGVQQLPWAPAPQAGSWAWGVITVVSGAQIVTVALDASIPNMVLQSSNGTSVYMWQLGVYGNTPAPGSTTPCFPTSGTWVGGRLYFGGAVQNRFDATISNGVNEGVATFSYTDPWDNVLDSSGISEVFNNTYTNQIQWFAAQDAGIVVGTLSAEILLFSSNTNDPITPTNIDSRIISTIGSTSIEPVRAGMATIFAQKYGRRIVEYLADAFSGKFSERTLNEWSKHLSPSGVSLLAYQQETSPTVWSMMNNGLLTGTTYRRFSRFVNEPPNIAAAFRVLHGRQRLFTSMCVVPGQNGLLDRLFIVTNDTGTTTTPPPNNYFIEIMQPLFDEGMTAFNGWLCDEAPGGGPGNSGYDCGGGNVFSFGTSGGLIGSDTTTADVSNLGPYSNNGGTPEPAVGQPIGAALNALGNAVYFNGDTALYMLPTYPSSGGAADQTQLSLSVWVASEDFPQQAGALFSSPALTGTEAAAKTTIVTSVLGVHMQPFGSGWQATSDGTSSLVTSTCGTDVYPTQPAIETDSSNPLSAGQVWNHFMISMKSNGDGTVTTTAAINETVILSSDVKGSIAYHGAMFPFATQQDAQKDDIGTAVWCIGGTSAATNDYTLSYKFGAAAPPPLVPPTAAQLMSSFISVMGLKPSKYVANAFIGVGDGAGGQNSYVPPGIIEALPAYQAYLTGVSARNSAAAQQNVTKTTYSGGVGNIPAEQSTGGYAGYRGSVAELLIWPGKFIDWTSSSNRSQLHIVDPINPGEYIPVSVGSNGAGTTLGAPYVYLSGGPDVFMVNRATGQNLVVNGNLQLSDLYPPGTPGQED